MRVTNNEREGRAAGALWAVRAKRDKLRLLDALWDQLGRDLDSFRRESAAERLFFCLHPEQDQDREAALAFYRSLGCETLPGDRFICGFLEGARDHNSI